VSIYLVLWEAKKAKKKGDTGEPVPEDMN